MSREAMDDERAIFTRTAETIALHKILGRVPAPPSHNAHLRSSGESGGYALDLRTERHLTSALAFLSSIRDDHLKVTAVCVREIGDGGLEVLVAENAKTSSEWGYLDDAKRGFERMFGLLAGASTTNRVLMREVVLGAIVTMCRDRILARARLRPTEDKTRFPAHIKEINTRLRRLRGFGNESSLVTCLQRLAERLEHYVQNAGTRGQRAAQIDSHLVEIIQECCMLSSISGWQDSLSHENLNIGGLKVDPSMCTAVIDLVEKLAQYSVSAKTLVAIARRHGAVRKMSVAAVRLQEEDFHQDVADQQNAAAKIAEQVFARAMARVQSGLSFDVLRKRIHLSKRQIDKAYKDSLTNALKNPGIHAEMQLIWYLDSHPSLKPPRIIASHKDACYLCNAFMAFHGMYTTPRSHGRLYPGWKLPAVGMADVRQGFIRELEGRLRARASSIISGEQRLEDPRESRNNSAITSRTSIMTLVEAEEAEAEANHGSTSDAETIKPGGDSSDEEGELSEASSDVVVAGAAEDAVDQVSVTRAGADADIDAGISGLGVSRVDFAEGHDVTSSHRANAADAAQQASARPDQDPKAQLDTENDTDNPPWQTVKRGQTVALRLTPTFRIHMEYSTSLNHPSRRLKFKIHEVSADEIAATDDSERVYDVHGDLPLLQDVFCRANCRSVCLQLRSSSRSQSRSQGTRRFRIVLG